MMHEDASLSIMQSCKCVIMHSCKCVIMQSCRSSIMQNDSTSTAFFHHSHLEIMHFCIYAFVQPCYIVAITISSQSLNHPISLVGSCKKTQRWTIRDLLFIRYSACNSIAFAFNQPTDFTVGRFPSYLDCSFVALLSRSFVCLSPPRA